MQGIEVQSLVGEDSTYRGAAKPMHQTTEPAHPGTCAMQQEEAPQWNVESSAHLPPLEKATCSNENPTEPKIIIINK